MDEDINLLVQLALKKLEDEQDLYGLDDSGKDPKGYTHGSWVELRETMWRVDEKNRSNGYET